MAKITLTESQANSISKTLKAAKKIKFTIQEVVEQNKTEIIRLYDELNYSITDITNCILGEKTLKTAKLSKQSLSKVIKGIIDSKETKGITALNETTDPH